tara:strand:- start:5357 stop:5761 length:405 start_codon:yes stop_codon:yes gene_type:complete
MKAEDLKKDNIVFFNNEIHWVLSVMQHEVLICNQKKEETTMGIGEVVGVRLNPVWMRRLGFSYSNPESEGDDGWDGVGTWENEGAKICFQGNKKISDSIPLHYGRNMDFKFKFVHEVQNLHSALRKESAEISFE